MALGLRYLSVLVVLGLGDLLWLSWFAPAMFRPTLGAVLLDNPRWSGAVLFYLFYTAGVLIFPLGLARDAVTALVYGALFGFVAYMTYDATNFATIKAWTAPLALMDTGWGAVLTGLASLVGFLVAQRLPANL
jgi:uncharacterized membrane protein